MKVIYLSGPITGAGPDWARPFMQAQEYFEAEGWEVVNPATLEPEDITYDGVGDGGLVSLRPFLARDFKYLAISDAIALLPGWSASRGANAELAMAKMMGLPVYYFTGYPIPEHSPINAKPKRELVELVIGGLE